MFGFGNMGGMMGKMMAAMQKFQAVKSELAAKSLHFTEGSGDATVELFANGLAEVSRVEIAPALLVPERKAELEALTARVVNQLSEATKNELKMRMMDFAKDIGG